MRLRNRLFRWIFRGLFLGLLALSASAWIESHFHYVLLAHWGRSHVISVAAIRGSLYVSCVAQPNSHNEWLLSHPSLPSNWEGRESEVARDWDVLGIRVLGFSIGEDGSSYWNRFVGIPCWFSTLALGIVCFFIWRKTAQPLPGRSFPVIRPNDNRTHGEDRPQST
jgi:hypothetical protein